MAAEINVSSSLQVGAGQVTLPFVFSASITKNLLQESAGMGSSRESCDPGAVGSFCAVFTSLVTPSSHPGGVGTAPAAPGAAGVGVWDRDFPVGHQKLKSGKFWRRKGKSSGSSPLPGALQALHASEMFGNQFLLWLLAVSESQEGKGNPKTQSRAQVPEQPWGSQIPDEWRVMEKLLLSPGTFLLLPPQKKLPEPFKQSSEGEQAGIGKTDLSLLCSC